MYCADLYAEFIDAQANLKIAQNKLARSQVETDRAADEERHWQEVVGRKRDLVATNCFINKRLPNETLSKVFMRLVDGFDAKYPWLLLAVCKLWNKICLENPNLWSRFKLSSGHICGQDTQQDDEAAVVLRTMKQLERSRCTEIHIQAGTLCECTSQVSRFRTIAEHSSRWKTIEFDGVNSRNALGAEYLQNLLPPDCQFTLLQSISWTALPADGSVLKLPFANYTALSRLNMVNLKNITDIKSDQQFPWDRLTALTLQPYCGPARDLLPILSLCQNLEFLLIRAIQKMPDEPLPSTATDVITLPHVTHAEISESTKHVGLMKHVLPYLRLPSLAYLTMALATGLEQPLSLIQRSSCGELLREFNMTLYAPWPKQRFAFLPPPSPHTSLS